MDISFKKLLEKIILNPETIASTLSILTMLGSTGNTAGALSSSYKSIDNSKANKYLVTGAVTSSAILGSGLLTYVAGSILYTKHLDNFFADKINDMSKKIIKLKLDNRTEVIETLIETQNILDKIIEKINDKNVMYVINDKHGKTNKALDDFNLSFSKKLSTIGIIEDNLNEHSSIFENRYRKFTANFFTYVGGELYKRELFNNIPTEIKLLSKYNTELLNKISKSIKSNQAPSPEETNTSIFTHDKEVTYYLKKCLEDFLTSAETIECLKYFTPQKKLYLHKLICGSFGHTVSLWNVGIDICADYKDEYSINMSKLNKTFGNLNMIKQYNISEATSAYSLQKANFKYERCFRPYSNKYFYRLFIDDVMRASVQVSYDNIISQEETAKRFNDLYTTWKQMLDNVDFSSEYVDLLKTWFIDRNKYHFDFKSNDIEGYVNGLIDKVNKKSTLNSGKQ